MRTTLHPQLQVSCWQLAEITSPPLIPFVRYTHTMLSIPEDEVSGPLSSCLTRFLPFHWTQPSMLAPERPSAAVYSPESILILSRPVCPVGPCANGRLVRCPGLPANRQAGAHLGFSGVPAACVHSRRPRGQRAKGDYPSRGAVHRETHGGSGNGQKVTQTWAIQDQVSVCPHSHHHSHSPRSPPPPLGPRSLTLPRSTASLTRRLLQVCTPRVLKSGSGRSRLCSSPSSSEPNATAPGLNIHSTRGRARYALRRKGLVRRRLGPSALIRHAPGRT